MPPKVKITKDAIINEATNIALESGIKNISIRNIAKRLGCSIAPIYVNFESIEQLLNEVSIQVEITLSKIMKQEYTDYPFINVGIGAIIFASKYKQLYMDMLLSDFITEDDDFSIEIMKQDPLFDGLNRDDIILLIKKLSVMTNGLCIEVVSEVSKMSTKEVLETLLNIGFDIIENTRVKKNLKPVATNFDLKIVDKIIIEYL